MIILVTKKLLDLGQYFEFENLNNEEIVKKINGKFEIINFNERVSKFLIKKLELKSDLELFNILNPILMTITRGSDGATFIFSKKVLNFELTSSACVVDSTGAGDAFISSIIKSCLKSNFDYNESNLKKWYLDSIKLTSKVVSKMGARGHLNTLFRIKKVNNFPALAIILNIVKERKSNVVILILTIWKKELLMQLILLLVHKINDYHILM